MVAKGARLVARRIIDIAQRHGVPVDREPPLARALFRQVAVGQEIPATLYRAVAEVLAYVYALRAAGAVGDGHRHAVAAAPALRPTSRSARGILGILTVLVVPLPAVLLDFLLTLNVTLSLLLLLVAMYIQQAARVLRLPVAAADHDALPAVAQRGVDPAHPAPRRRGADAPRAA